MIMVPSLSLVFPVPHHACPASTFQRPPPRLPSQYLPASPSTPALPLPPSAPSTPALPLLPACLSRCVSPSASRVSKLLGSGSRCPSPPGGPFPLSSFNSKAPRPRSPIPHPGPGLGGREDGCLLLLAPLAGDRTGRPPRRTGKTESWELPIPHSSEGGGAGRRL